MKIEHANMTVSNLEKSIEFYNSLLGFTLQWKGKAMGNLGPIRACHIGNEKEGIFFALFEAEQVEKADSDYGRIGMNHIGLIVNDLNSYRNKLEQLNVNIHMEADYEPGERIYFFDPDGIEIELVEYK